MTAKKKPDSENELQVSLSKSQIGVAGAIILALLSAQPVGQFFSPQSQQIADIRRDVAELKSDFAELRADVKADLRRRVTAGN